MRALTVRLPDDTLDRLRQLARDRGISMSHLVEELSTAAIAELDAETRFRARAAAGSPEKALEILEKLDRADGRG